MKCASCQHENQSTDKFCSECGSGLITNCASCGATLKHGAKFCSECGTATVRVTPKALPAVQDGMNSAATHPAHDNPETKAALEGERRQLTVLFCDMVGFTELSGRVDPEVLNQIIRAYEDACAVCITRYEGYVYQRLGDGIVAFFGYPLAHEGEAERAIRAGLEIVEALSRLDVPEAGKLSVRIGIASGLVVVQSAEKGAVGETMNLASRLQAIAQPGGIVVSERVQRLAAGSFDYQDLGERKLKGISQPARAYRIKGVSRVGSRFEAATQAGLTPLVGREHEIAMLSERWRLAQDGEGQVVLLSGEPGIGKSRILSGLLERLQFEGASTMRLQCSPYHTNSAFYPMIDNLERRLNFSRDDSPDFKLDRLEDLLVGDFGLPVNDVRFIATMLSIPCDERYGMFALTPQKHKDETIRTLVDIAEAAARRQCAVMAYEDVHWADPTSIEVLDHLVERLRTIPLLVVLTHRPEFQSRWSQHGHVTTLSLSKLTRAQSSVMVAKLTNEKTLPAGLLAQIVARTDGVPLFVEELTRAILESGELKETEDGYEYLGTERASSIPATLRDSLMARLDRFSAVKEVAQIGAAIGREFSYELIAAVAPKPKSELDLALEQLTDSGLAFRRGSPPEAVYTFKHALVQDAAYDSLLKTSRQSLHRTIARVIKQSFPHTVESEPETLAHHLTAGGQFEEAMGCWLKAGAQALKRIALKEAIAHLNQGLELVGKLPPSSQRDLQEVDLRTRLGTTWMALKGWGEPEIWTSLHPALELAKSLGSGNKLLPIYYGLTTNVVTQGRVAESLHWVNEMLAAAQKSDDLDFLIEAERAACVTRYWKGDLAETCAHGERVIALYREADHRHLAESTNTDPKATVGVHVAWSSWLLGYPERAVKIDEASLSHSRQVNHPFDLGFTLSFSGQLFDFLGEPAQVLARADEAEKLGRLHSLPFIADVLAQLMKGVAWIRTGQIAKGVPHLQRTLELWRATNLHTCAPFFRAIVAEGMAVSGQVEEGLQLIEENLTQVARPGWGERVYLAEFLRLKGWMLTLQEDLDGAEQNFQASLEWAREQQAKSSELRAAVSLARLWQSQGKRRDAHALLAPVYDWFTEGFETKDLIEARELLDDLASVR